MTQDIFIVLGGIGMFLLGMDVMTTALRDVAGSKLRHLLSQFTTTPLRGVATGAATTAMIQSSSATTVMTVGFVGAGLMSMPQAMGVIYGANIGTTATGWLVSLLGFKLQLDALAMVTLLPASLSALLGHGTLARAGRIVAGLCLLLIGLNMMQDGMGQASALITPQSLPGKGLASLLTLVGTGLVVTVLIQSSSAALALALVMLESGSINLTQAATIVVGMNIGTTFTAILASLGGSPAMRQTAVANLIFNLATSFLALPLLLIWSGTLVHLSAVTGPLTALLLFHTGFNLLGTLIFLPLTPRFTGLIIRLIPDRPPKHLITLDRGLLGDSSAALIAAQAGAALIAQRLFSALATALKDAPDYRDLSALEPIASEAIDELENFLSEIRLPADPKGDENVYSALLHQADHLRRLLGRVRQTARIHTLREDRVLKRPARAFGAILDRAARSQTAGLEPERLRRLDRLVQDRTNRHRRGLMLGQNASAYSLQEVFAHADAMRWFKRALHHSERIGYYDRVAWQGLQRQPPPQEPSQEPSD